MNKPYQIPELPLAFNFESVTIYKQLTLASRALAELKGVAKTIPNETILLNTLVLQEAKDSPKSKISLLRKINSTRQIWI